MDEQLLKYVLLAGLWTAYCAVHSLLISPPVLRWVRERFPNGHRYHRLAFNIFSTLTIIPLGIYTLSFTAPAVFRWEDGLRIPQAVLIIAAAALIIAGAAKYDFRTFLGISQMKEADACRSIGTDCVLNTSGVLGFVRHPWYTAVVILLWARDLDPAALIVNTVLTIYVVVGTYLEERKLVAEFGQTYRDYQRDVSMFLPFKWLKSHIGRM